MAVKSTAQITITDITDAYSISLSSETHTFGGGINGVAEGHSCSTQVSAYCGKDQCKNVTVGSITCPTGIQSTVEYASADQQDKKNPIITFRTTALISSDCEAIIPITVDGITINKKFSFAVAKTGATGQNGTSVTISSTEVKYQAHSSGTAAPTGTWLDTVPTVNNGQFLWTRTVVNYSDGKSTTSYSVAYKGTNGSNGANGTSVTITSTEVKYQAHSNGTTAPTGTWSNTVPDVNNGQFLWTRTIVNFSDGKSTTSYSVAYTGIDGSNGADAIRLEITSSGGTVFKNSTGSTTLTAHVYVGSVEQSINATNGVVTDPSTGTTIGTVKWYKEKETTGAAAKSITVNAHDVTNASLYTAQLE